MSDAIRFELDRLISYDRESIIEELRRVAALVEEPTLTQAAFSRHSRVHMTTVVRKFAGWREALDAAGLGHRYSGQSITSSMREQTGRGLTDQQILDELRRVAAEAGTDYLTVEIFRACSPRISEVTIRRRFGSWSEGLRRAGLKMSPLGRRWTDDDYFENLLATWTHYGRPPTFAEMNRPPSRITGHGYAAKFGTWTRAKAAFVGRVNSDLAQAPQTATGEQLELPQPKAPRSTIRPEDSRQITLGMRYKILSRDRFRCSICGRSPANDLSVNLHVDHVVPVAAGGKTTEENLRALCSDCNIGKGSKIEPASE